MKIFQGFQVDLAADFTGLSTREIDWLRQSGMVSPERTSEGYRYSFTDLLMLRLVRVLKDHGVKARDIKQAHEYLEHLDPSRRLSRLKLYIRDDNKSILYLGEAPEVDSLVSLTDWGQLVVKGVLTIIPVGNHLEAMRLDVIRIDERLSRRVSRRKLVPLSTLKAQYGVS